MSKAIRIMRKSAVNRFLSILVVSVLSFGLIVPPGYAQLMPQMPAPGTMVSMSPSYAPALIRGIKVFADNPLQFDFIIDTGDSGLAGGPLEVETIKLVKYFMATLTVPEEELWVNLSPYEKDRIIPEQFGQTGMGRDLLAQDYFLKQLTASLIYPEDDLGRKFWNRVYKKAAEKFGTNDIPINTFNKVWIVPDRAVVYQQDDMALIAESHLKVMLEEDYLSMMNNLSDKDKGLTRMGTEDVKAVSSVSSDVIREVLLPEIEKEVNSGKNFASLRQIYNAMILATWYKNNLRESILGQVYVDKNKTNGINIEDRNAKQRIYKQYLEAYKKGAYNYIKEDFDPVTEEVIPRKYFSGGFHAPQFGRQVGQGVRDRAMLSVRGRQNVANLRQLTLRLVSAEAPRVVTARVGMIENPTDGLRNYADWRATRAGDRAMMTDEEIYQVIRDADLELDDPNAIYAMGLFAKFLLTIDPNLAKRPAALRMALKQFDPKNLSVKDGNMFVSALLTAQQRREFMRVSDYAADVRVPENLEAAKTAIVLAYIMNAGLGDALVRFTYLMDQAGRNKIGPKSLDLFFKFPVTRRLADGTEVLDVERVSIAELKYLIALNLSQKFQELIMQETVNDQSLPWMREFLEQTVYLFDRIDKRPGTPKRTYAQMLQDTPGITSAEMIVERLLPVIDAANNQLTAEFRGTGSHGQLGSNVAQGAKQGREVFRKALGREAPEDAPLIVAVFNGDGVNNAPDEYIVGHVVRNKLPITLITTTKVELDKKGGQLGLQITPDGKIRIQIMELAQAKTAGQADIFSEMGLTVGEFLAQLFNTNIALLNYTVLEPFLNELEEVLGEDDFLKEFKKAVTPDLILNEKEKEVKGPDGKVTGTKTVRHLEGAMGSALLNFNAYLTNSDRQDVKDLLKKHGFENGLVHIVNVGVDERTDFFTPTKFAIDHWLYGSDHFRIDPDTKKLVNRRRGHLPGFGDVFADKKSFYGDMQNVVDAMGDASVVNLDHLDVRLSDKSAGVLFAGAEMKGTVQITNDSGQKVNLNDDRYRSQLPTVQDGARTRLNLENISIFIDEKGEMRVRSIVKDPDIPSHSVNGKSMSEILDKIIKEYDIRGFDGMGDKAKYPQQMDETVLQWIGRGLGSTDFTSEAHGKTVRLRPGDTFVIAGDNGPSTGWVKENLTKGLTEAGINVIDLGTTVSGHLYSSISRLNAQGGLYVTRSHVEVGTNGAKPVVGGITLFGDMLQALKGPILSGTFEKAEVPGTVDNSGPTRNRASRMYNDSLRKEFAGLKDRLLSQTPTKVVVNLNGGSAVRYKGLIQELLGDNLVDVLRDASDPWNRRGGLADPSREDAVALSNPKADIMEYSRQNPDRLIFNFDLDSDRVSVLQNGKLYLGDEMFYPIIEYMLTLDPYKDLNKVFYYDSRMKTEFRDWVQKFGGIAKIHPKGHSKVKASMDLQLRELAQEAGQTVQQFLAARPGFRMAQSEFSLHEFLSNEKGESFDDAIRFMFFWLDAFSQVQQAHGKTDLDLGGYVANVVRTDSAVRPSVQLKEQRFGVPEDVKVDVMTGMTEALRTYMGTREDFEDVSDWRSFEGATKPRTLIDIDGVFHYISSQGDVFWGWSNTSPKVAIGVQGTDEQKRRDMAEAVVALYVHTRDAVAEQRGVTLPTIDDTETYLLRSVFGAASAAEVEQIVRTKYPTREAALGGLDRAMTRDLPQSRTVIPGEDKYGGINLNPALLDLQIRRDDNGIPLPMPMQPVQQMNIDGFLPVIINIVPTVNLPLNLSESQEIEYDQVTMNMN